MASTGDEDRRTLSTWEEADGKKSTRIDWSNCGRQERWEEEEEAPLRPQPRPTPGRSQQQVSLLQWALLLLPLLMSVGSGACAGNFIRCLLLLLFYHSPSVVIVIDMLTRLYRQMRTEEQQRHRQRHTRTEALTLLTISLTADEEHLFEWSVLWLLLLVVVVVVVLVLGCRALVRHYCLPATCLYVCCTPSSPTDCQSVRGLTMRTVKKERERERRWQRRMCRQAMEQRCESSESRRGMK